MKQLFFIQKQIFSKWKNIKKIFFASLLMIDEVKRKQILEFWRASHKKKAIATAVNVSLPTVRKYIREGGAHSQKYENKILLTIISR